MATLSIILDWSGPFLSVDQAKKAAKEFDLGEVIYLACGKRKYQREVSLQYVGISNNPNSRFNKNHHGFSEIPRSFEVWIGEVISHGVAGRRASRHPVAHSRVVDRAEWAIAYFLALPLNKKKRRRPPPESIVVFNRFFKSDFDTRRSHRAHSNWPDFIEYDADYDRASIVWFGAPPRRRRLYGAEIKELAIPVVKRPPK